MMRRAAVALLVACALPAAAHRAEARTAVREAGSIHGRVLDGERGTPVPGALVRIAQLGRREASHGDGAFHFARLAPGRYTVVAERIGYAPASAEVVVGDGATAEVTLRLLPAAIQVEALRVTAAGGGEDFRPTSTLSGAALRRRLASTVPATLAGEPGVAQSYNGPGASQPIIRGLSGDRVLVLEDGQRTGDIAGSAADHGVMVDPLSAERIEVVRGPASILYGSNALGGVVNVVREEIPRSLPDRVTGSAALQGESASGGVTGGVVASGALGAWALRGEGSLRRMGDTRTALGTLPTSGLESRTAAAGVSHVGESGHAGLALRDYDVRYGVPGEFGGREVVGAHQGGVHIEARRTTLRGEAVRVRRTGPFASARAELNLARFDQREMERDSRGAEFTGNHFLQHLATLNLLGRVEGGAVGAWAMVRGREASGSSTGSRTARQWSAAGFGYRELRAGRFGVELGARYDWTRIVPEGDGSVAGVPVEPRTFGAVSASGAVHADLGGGVELGARAARAFRTPSIEELYSRGPHLAAFSYEIGNPRLAAETGVGTDVFVRLARARLRAEVTAFRNGIANYVYYAPTGELDPRFGRYPVYRARGDDARFRGVEGKVQWEPRRAWAVEAGGSYVRADARVDGRWAPLPAIPPAQGSLRVRRDVPRWFVEAGVDGAARQDRVSPDTVGGRAVESPTPAYLLAGAGAGLRLDAGGRLHTLTLQVDNATDRAWREHTSRLKEVAPGPGVNARLLYRVDF